MKMTRRELTAGAAAAAGLAWARGSEGQGATVPPSVVGGIEVALKEAKFAYAANLEYEMDENDPTAGVRDSFGYVKKALA